jgi:hypothetical protein
MTNQSLQHRVSRLEQATNSGLFNRAEQMRLTRDRHIAMSPAERALWDCKRVEAAVRALDAHDEPDGTSAAAVQLIQRRIARRHLAAMASLKAPDISEPDAFDIDRRLLWERQQDLRAEARNHLESVTLAAQEGP